jgi:hypothetical protein
VLGVEVGIRRSPPCRLALNPECGDGASRSPPRPGRSRMSDAAGGRFLALPC